MEALNPCGWYTDRNALHLRSRGNSVLGTASCTHLHQYDVYPQSITGSVDFNIKRLVLVWKSRRHHSKTKLLRLKLEPLLSVATRGARKSPAIYSQAIGYILMTFFTQILLFFFFFKLCSIWLPYLFECLKKIVNNAYNTVNNTKATKNGNK